LILISEIKKTLRRITVDSIKSLIFGLRIRNEKTIKRIYQIRILELFIIKRRIVKSQIRKLIKRKIRSSINALVKCSKINSQRRKL
jgi:hypothetical protein